MEKTMNKEGLVMGATLLGRFVATFPRVKKELQYWASLADTLPAPLRFQALSSVEYKAFHCLGGSIYAHYPGVDKGAMLRLIVALQTMSDYLDNLCDRLPVENPDSFRVLHTSFVDALTPGAAQRDYYALYPHQEVTYLPTLVETCQNLIAKIPHYPRVQHSVLILADRYCELQALKHVSGERERLLREWAQQNPSFGLEWYEWTAACGSTLGIFLLLALAYGPAQAMEKAILEAYFPWLQGLHILLDYLIDLREDEEHGDLNFVAFYPNQEVRARALGRFAQKSQALVENLPNPKFHTTVVHGLIALYGSDPKVRLQSQENTIRNMAGQGQTLRWLHLCKALRFFGAI